MKKETLSSDLTLLAACIAAIFALTTSDHSHMSNTRWNAEERPCSEGNFRINSEAIDNVLGSRFSESEKSFDPKLVRRREGTCLEWNHRNRITSIENSTFVANENWHRRTTRENLINQQEQRRNSRMVNKTDRITRSNLERDATEKYLNIVNRVSSNNIQRIERTERARSPLTRIRSNTREIFSELEMSSHGLSKRRSDVTANARSSLERVSQRIVLNEQGQDRFRAESEEIRTDRISKDRTKDRETRLARSEGDVRSRNIRHMTEERPYEEYNRVRFSEIRREYAQKRASVKYLEAEGRTEIRDERALNRRQSVDGNRRVSATEQADSRKRRFISDELIDQQSTGKIDNFPQRVPEKKRLSSERVNRRMPSENTRYHSGDRGSRSEERTSNTNSERSRQSTERYSSSDVKLESSNDGQDIKSNERAGFRQRQRNNLYEIRNDRVASRSSTEKTERVSVSRSIERIDRTLDSPPVIRETAVDRQQWTDRMTSADSIETINRSAISRSMEPIVRTETRYSSHVRRETESGRSRERRTDQTSRNAITNAEGGRTRRSVSRSLERIGRSDTPDTSPVRRETEYGLSPEQRTERITRRRTTTDVIERRIRGSESRSVERAGRTLSRELSHTKPETEPGLSREQKTKREETASTDSMERSIRCSTSRSVERIDRIKFRDSSRVRRGSGLRLSCEERASLQNSRNIIPDADSFASVNRETRDTRSREQNVKESGRFQNGDQVRDSFSRKRKMGSLINELGPNGREARNTFRRPKITEPTMTRKEPVFQDHSREAASIKKNKETSIGQRYRDAPQRDSRDKKFRNLQEKPPQESSLKRVSLHAEKKSWTVNNEVQVSSSRFQEVLRSQTRVERSRETSQHKLISLEVSDFPSRVMARNIRKESIRRREQINNQELHSSRGSKIVMEKNAQEQSVHEFLKGDNSVHQRKIRSIDSKTFSEAGKIRMSSERLILDNDSQSSKLRRVTRNDELRTARELVIGSTMLKPSTNQERRTESRKINEEQRSELQDYRESNQKDTWSRSSRSVYSPTIREVKKLNLRRNMEFSIEQPNLRVSFASNSQREHSGKNRHDFVLRSSPSNRIVNTDQRDLSSRIFLKQDYRQINGEQQEGRLPQNRAAAERENIRSIRRNNVRNENKSGSRIDIRRSVSADSARVTRIRYNDNEFRQELRRESGTRQTQLSFSNRYFRDSTNEPDQRVLSRTNRSSPKSNFSLQFTLRNKPKIQRGNVNLRRDLQKRLSQVIVLENNFLNEQRYPQLMKNRSMVTTQEGIIQVNFSSSSTVKKDNDSVIKLLHLIKDLVLMSCLVLPLTNYFDKKKTKEENETW